MTSATNGKAHTTVIPGQETKDEKVEEVQDRGASFSICLWLQSGDTPRLHLNSLNSNFLSSSPHPFSFISAS
ncbi:hypothetical protein J4Q44_G00247070 [Coregonus suidteri]|uniref:Uncharacterized protein n=1 Tax=Coregonus suidteri TaxID=861788 RepID=A0AAN8LI62_9TELE